MPNRLPAPHARDTRNTRAQAVCALTAPWLAALWLAAGSAQAASGAGAAGKALDALLAQGSLAFDNLAAACQTAAPGMASTWQAQAPAVRQKLTQAAPLALVTGQPFCQSMLNQVQQADVAALARHMRQNYERIRQQVRARPLPHPQKKAVSP